MPQAPTRSSPFGDLALLALPGRCLGRRCETYLPPPTRTATVYPLATSPSCLYPALCDSLGTTIGDTPSLLSLRYSYLPSAWTLRPVPKRKLPSAASCTPEAALSFRSHHRRYLVSFVSARASLPARTPRRLPSPSCLRSARPREPTLCHP
ncbi:hypothetical protein B0H14DRAFT_1289372 [Mycena olivaceomarginata]|nr:hypothetical protein B0H14DRAFT_1289372 [Mycena olivaceomarginata]